MQQTHILSDIQQHQHRFASQNQLFNPANKVFGQKAAHNILVEPSVQTQLPTETTVLQLPQQQNSFFINPQHAQHSQHPQHPQHQPLQGRFRQPNNVRPNNELHVQHHTQTNFVPNFSNQQNVVFPQQPLFDRSLHQHPAQLAHQQLPHQNQQQIFQRSVSNQQGDANLIFKPSQPFPAQPPTILLPAAEQNNFGQPLQPVQTLQQNHLFHQNHLIQPQNGQFAGNPIVPQPPVNSLSPPLQSQPQFQQFPNQQQIQFNQQQQQQQVNRGKSLKSSKRSHMKEMRSHNFHDNSR